jgi:hypothetical protein
MKLKLISILSLIAGNLLGATLGNTNNGTTTDPLASYINASRFVATTNLNLTSISVQTTPVLGRFKCAIYNDNNILIRSTIELTNLNSGWNTFNLTSPVVVTNGLGYWFAVWSDDNNASVYFISGTANLRWGFYAYGNWPNQLVTTSGTTATRYSIYATGNYITTNNPPVTNLSNVTLAWDASPSSVSGYYLYIGNTSQSYTNQYNAGNNLTYTVSNVLVGATYYFVAKSYDSSGIESVPSNEISYTIPPPVITNNVPNPPSLFRVIGINP